MVTRQVLGAIVRTERQVSSYGYLFVEGRELFSFRDEVDPTFMLLFRRDDLRRVFRSAAERPGLGLDETEGNERIEFAVTSEVLRERLDVLGVGVQYVAETFVQLAADARDRVDRWVADERWPRDLIPQLEEEAAFLSKLDLQAWQREVRDRFDHGEGRSVRDAPNSLGKLLDLWDYVDPRVVLRAVAEAFPDVDVILDVTDLEEGGWFDTKRDPREAALDQFGWVIANGAPVIVLAEGSSDITVLSAALRVLRPHLEGFIRFADFAVGAEGGASALVRLVRALWSAGVANRIVAVFDNDTASADALRSLDVSSLPANLRVFVLPEIELARRYPTRGPSGLVEMDVNGLAGSIELYLGSDVLRDGGDDGAYRPVQWTGFVQRLGRYQGELMNKADLLERFQAKVVTATAEGGPRTDQDWSGLQLILDALIATLKAG